MKSASILLTALSVLAGTVVAAASTTPPSDEHPSPLLRQRTLVLHYNRDISDDGDGASTHSTERNNDLRISQPRGSGGVSNAATQLGQRSLKSWVQQFFEKYYATPKPTPSPRTPKPTPNPTTEPTSNPVEPQVTQKPVTSKPSVGPTGAPSFRPSQQPSIQPSSKPSGIPSTQPSSVPSLHHSFQPSSHPSSQPSDIPSDMPSSRPSESANGGMVPSTDCTSGFLCLQNKDFGTNDPTKYNMDLSLELLNPASAGAFVSARARWMELIVGDVGQYKSSVIPDIDKCANKLPQIIDDVHICGRDEEIDGKGKVLGSAGPLYVRVTEKTSTRLGTYTAITGRMRFDTADVAGIIASGRWEGMILHEMGHVLGMGTGWRTTGITDANLIYHGTKGIEVWTKDWNCTLTDAPPVETDGGVGTKGGHWDEQCMKDELMTGYVARPGVAMPLSRLTVAALDDLGYKVNYEAADDYDGRNTTCCNTMGIEMLPSQPNKPPLSELGMAEATAWGRQVLSESQRPGPSLFNAEENDDGLIYVGDQFVTVLFEENGLIYDVHVTSG